MDARSTPIHVWRRGEHAVSTDPARLDRAVIHGYLARSNGSEGIPRATVERWMEACAPSDLYTRG